MRNQPLTSNDQSKVMIFILLLLPSIFVGLGVPFAIFLAFGVFMLKKSGDFGHIESAVRNFKWYARILCVGIVIFSVTLIAIEGVKTGIIIFMLTILLITEAHILLMQKLFLTPLEAHADWVATNGIFSSKPNTTEGWRAEPDVDISKGDQKNPDSDIDDLLKLAQLKVDGHITEDEFNSMKLKILNSK